MSSLDHAPHPRVTNPRVPISRKTSNTYIARCHHCTYELEGPIKAYLIEQTNYHRHLHRTGQIPHD